MVTVTPHLWFEKGGREAAEFYCSVFPDSKVIESRDFGPIGPDKSTPISTVTFEILGQRVMILSAGPDMKLDEAFSFFVECDTQEEVDTYWDRLTDGGEESQCGWLKDRYGVSWQIVPKLLEELMGHEDKEAAARATEAMLGMKKLDCSKLQAAFGGVA